MRPVECQLRLECVFVKVGYFQGNGFLLISCWDDRFLFVYQEFFVVVVFLLLLLFVG